MAAASPPGITGPFQPCGSPRKNWTAPAPMAIASASGSATWMWAPMRGMHRAYFSGPGPRRRSRSTYPTNPQYLSHEPTLGQADGQSDEPGDDAGHDDHALVARGRDHLQVQSDQQRGQPGGGRDDVRRRARVRIPYDQAEDERDQPGHQHENGRDVLGRVRLPVIIQDVQVRAVPESACHDDHLLAVDTRQSSPARRAGIQSFANVTATALHLVTAVRPMLVN